MSGGHWDYIQYRFTDVIEDIEKLIEQNGKLKSEQELKDYSWNDEDWYNKYPEDRYHFEYPEEVLEQFRKSIDIIKTAQIYIHRMDWLLSGDDGEESFLVRLSDELKENKL